MRCQNRFEWFCSRRWAASWTTTYSRSVAGRATTRRLTFMFPSAEQLPHRVFCIFTAIRPRRRPARSGQASSRSRTSSFSIRESPLRRAGTDGEATVPASSSTANRAPGITRQNRPCRRSISSRPHPSAASLSSSRRRFSIQAALRWRNPPTSNDGGATTRRVPSGRT